MTRSFASPPPALNGAKFITFEGGDGSGKTTQLRRLSQALEARHIPHIVTREPGGSPQAERIRALVVQGPPEGWDGITEAFLMAASRRDHPRHTIWPALAEGVWVLCDRFADSTWAYQGYGHGLGEDFVHRLNALTMGTFAPDLTFVFQLSASCGVTRKKRDAVTEDRFENLPATFHECVRQGYADLLRQEPQRCVAINADHSIETLTKHLLQHLTEKGWLAP